MAYDKQRKYLYTEETLQEVCLGIHSMCVGAESKYFNGHTNITDDDFLVFGVKGLTGYQQATQGLPCCSISCPS